jgi:hypothetical protein
MVDVRTGHRWLPVTLTVAGLVALGACAGGGSTAPATDPATTAAADAFAQCMEEQGVPAPEGGTRITGPGPGHPAQQGAPVTRRNAPPPPDGVDPEKWEAALEACGDLGVRRTITPGS